MQLKPGVKTTEFWGKIALQVLAIGLAALGDVDAKWAVAAAGILELGYQGLRTYLKSSQQ